MLGYLIFLESILSFHFPILICPLCHVFEPCIFFYPYVDLYDRVEMVRETLAKLCPAAHVFSCLIF